MRWLWCGLWLILCGSAAGAAPSMPNDQCLKCHGERWIGSMAPEALSAMVRIPSGEAPVQRAPEAVAKLHTPRDSFKNSVHAGLACVDCHRGIERLPHAQRLPVISCTDCHSQSQAALAGSVHDPAAPGNGHRRPACADCHGATHSIQSLSTPRTHRQNEAMAQTCAKCHDESKDHASSPADSYLKNVHGKALFEKGLAAAATCADCHGGHAIRRPADSASTLHPTNVPKTCGRCHDGITDTYYTSIHGQNLLAGKLGAATCTSCHTSHGIRTVSEPFLLSVVQECSHCHLDLGRSYLTSYHGKATALGWGKAAVCSSCHGAHDILPSANPQSRVSQANLQQTCGKCHEKVNANFVKYITHADFNNPKEHPQVFYTWLVMTCLLLSVLAVFIPHSLLWFQRSFLDRLSHLRGHHIAPHSERRIERFRPIHRLTHALVVVSFLGLVATGFPLKYSNTAWAHEIASLLGGIHTMGILHRILAIVTFSYAGVHALFLAYFFWKRCPRPRWRYLIGPDSLVFSLRDLKDFLAMIRWFFWLGPRPKFERWAYFEKFDYWGEIWGVFAIGGTGLILWLPEFFTRWLPGWVLNCAVVVHSIEALLAASVIFLVHFFNTHIRPEKFPIDMVMLTGQMTETEMKEERGDEYARLVASGELERRVRPPVALRWRILGFICGMVAFAIGVTMIVLALKTELTGIFK